MEPGLIPQVEFAREIGITIEPQIWLPSDYKRIAPKLNTTNVLSQLERKAEGIKKFFGMETKLVWSKKRGLTTVMILPSDSADISLDGFSYAPHNIDKPEQAVALLAIGLQYFNALGNYSKELRKGFCYPNIGFIEQGPVRDFAVSIHLPQDYFDDVVPQLNENEKTVREALDFKIEELQEALGIEADYKWTKEKGLKSVEIKSLLAPTMHLEDWFHYMQGNISTPADCLGMAAIMLQYMMFVAGYSKEM